MFRQNKYPGRAPRDMD